MIKKRHTYNMGIIGNCSYLSYIDERASVVWQCWPYFDSSFIFGSLMDEQKGGEFSVTPDATQYSTRQYYLDNTNVLVTEFETSQERFRVIDFAPRFELHERYFKPLMLFRKIERISGSPSIKVVCRPRGNYGELVGSPLLGSNHITYKGLEAEVRLTTNVSKVSIINEHSFTLTENKYLVLSWGEHLEAPLISTFEEFLRKTTHYWRRWIQRSSIPELYQKEVIRSGLILKLHSFEDTGAVIASGTTSLPEWPETERNWDYRYCWIRDSYFTLAALNSMSHFTEAERFSHFIQNQAQRDTGHFQPVYKIDGIGSIPERVMDLKGYMNYGPVRVGNDAYTQIQNDVYGQILLSLLPLYTDQRIYESDSRPPLSLIERLLNKIDHYMDQPDAGIWEYRNRKQKHCEAYLFHWAGALASLKIADRLGNQGIKEKARVILLKASENIEACYNKDLGGYTMAHSVNHFNASEFLLITMNYLDPKSERARAHLRALEKELKTANDLIFRYRDEDDFGETKATFLICSFWYAEALACVGRIDDAMRVFDNLIKTSNNLGIFSEDVSPDDFSQWGNFGQTYSHVGLINTAYRISRHLDRPVFF